MAEELDPGTRGGTALWRHLSVWPASDAVRSTHPLEIRIANVELLRHRVHGHMKVIPERLKRDCRGLCALERAEAVHG